MAQDFEQQIKDVFGESISRLSQFQGDQLKKLMDRINAVAREAVKDDIVRLQTEINELNARIAKLEGERAEAAAEAIETSF